MTMMMMMNIDEVVVVILVGGINDENDDFNFLMTEKNVKVHHNKRRQVQFL